jgi:hypothetical protein
LGIFFSKKENKSSQLRWKKFEDRKNTMTQHKNNPNSSFSLSDIIFMGGKIYFSKGVKFFREHSRGAKKL